MNTEMRRCLFVVLPLALALTVGCSTSPPTSPSREGVPGTAERRVGSVGGGDGVCGDEEEEPCLEPGKFALTAPNGDSILGILQQTGDWLVTGGTGRFEGSEGSASLLIAGEDLDLLMNFEAPRIGSRPLLATGTLTLTESSSQPSSICLSGTQLLRTFTGVVESLGLVTLDLETCVPVE